MPTGRSTATASRHRARSTWRPPAGPGRRPGPSGTSSGPSNERWESRGWGSEDDFFALGGHSLLAISLFNELERIAGRRLPLATIFEASTPEALAAQIAADAPVERWDNLVPLKPDGSRPPLFVVSAGDGNLVGFAHLARRLSPEQPLYGLQPSGLDGRHLLDRGVEEMAERYLARIRETRPHGPYILAGRCNGATVAYEMAQRLRAAGEEVPLLISLDSDPPPAGPVELRPGIGYDQVMEAAFIKARAAGEAVPNPDSTEGATALADWLREPVGPGITRYLHEFWHWHGNLREAWPDPLGRDGPALGAWAWNHGRHQGLAAELVLPAAASGCRTPGNLSWDWAMTTAWEQLGREPADPLSADGWGEFRTRLLEPVEGTRLNRYLHAASQRPDIRRTYPRPLDGDMSGLIDWAWFHGTGEGLAPSLLPAPNGRLPRRLRLDLARRRASAPLDLALGAVARNARAAGIEARARALEAIERRIDRPLPGARARVERRVVSAARHARATYRARPWPGRVALITSTEFRDKPPYAAWPLRAQGGLEVRELPVGHIAMLRQSGSPHLARCIEELIDEAMSIE